MSSLTPHPADGQRPPPHPAAQDTLSRPGDDSMSMTGRQVEALVRVIEGGAAIRRRYQFFVWMQNHVHVLLPHVLAVCGTWQRQRRELVYEVFNSVTVPPSTLAAFSGAAPVLMSQAARAWVGRQGRALAMTTGDADGTALGELRAELAHAGLGHFVVHGVSRPQRPGELESLFLLAGPEAALSPDLPVHLELLMPHLHATYLRVLDTERTLATTARTAPPSAAPAADAAAPSQITDREREILRWVREGRSNQQIGEQLGISALTVKNHVQKILRKLGAANRAQAVAIAMTARMLPPNDSAP
jgi:transcriptional regulator EpsA